MLVITLLKLDEESTIAENYEKQLNELGIEFDSMLLDTCIDTINDSNAAKRQAG